MSEAINPVRNQLVEKLKQSGFKREQIAAAEDLRSCYGYDATRQSRSPLLAVLPENHEQVVTVIRLAADQGLKIFPRGAGSGMSGGSIPSADGIILSLT
ncbi:MAG: FAD-binding oxidoreductase, partial [Deltaproteobacteria bacterium]|nr:FAD-binding oxidoreductase [Deltaproteobacteria bacterium]